MEKWELAYEDYHSGMKYKDIAEKYEVSINTVKSWKSRKWNNDHSRGAPDKKSVHTKHRKVATKKKVQLVIENDGLTEQQKMFCLYYLQYFNATKAYQEAYQCAYSTAKTNGNLLLTNTHIKKELTRLKAELQQDVYADAEMLLNDLLKQAKSDITDYISYYTVDEPLIDMFGNKIRDKDTNKIITVRRSYVEFKDMDQVDGSLIQEVKKGKDGISIKLVDKQKALLEVLKRIENTESLKTVLLEKQIQKAEAEILKLKSQNGDEGEELEEDGFLEALESEGEELWQEE